MSMQSVAYPAIALTPPKRNALRHIPGDEGWPIIVRAFDRVRVILAAAGCGGSRG